MAVLCLCMTGIAMADTFEAYGMEMSEDTISLELGKTQITDFEEFISILRRMPKLRAVNMYNTKMEVEMMDRLTELFPDIQFGWTLRVAKYRVRSDATAFSTLRQPDEKPRYKSASYEPLRFCWQIHGVDLGHSSIESLEFLKPLTQLHYLILADNKVTDISVLGELKELEYIELFMNDITDVTPLQNLPHLIDLNLSRTRIDDLSQLYPMKQLKRLWISRIGRAISEEEKAALMEALPNTEIHFTANCTAEGWRKHPRFKKVQNSFRAYTGMVFLPFTDEERAL